MESFYLILVIVLFALAISDLVVGVSNDAVNFLNSAIGSKAAPKWVIFGVASLGVLVGSVFSGGMMEVARKGIFNPDMFVFSEIMMIFLAVMITDVILLDMFNTFGMPTSTTVSIVFELLGAAVAVSLVKLHRLGDEAGHISEYINSDKALAIISGILLSVIVAFTVGAVVMYLSRLIFSFKQKKTLQRYGAIFGGFSIAAMTYFMVIKGAKGAVFMTDDIMHFINNNLVNIILFSFVGWTVIFQILNWFFKIDIPKIVVIVGTFGLAMAFAGNDLVNFIGVPLAGYQAFKAWIAAGGADPAQFNMAMLAGKQAAPTLILLIAGLVMIITLITSKKAKNVVATSVDLARQSEGDERFGSSVLSRAIVRNSVNINKRFDKYMPGKLSRFIDSRFEYPTDGKVEAMEDGAAFDKIRAAVNLIVAGILISIGTSFKLPLSTTYVTFMVAMGTSLADRAWGRDSAVYRISGVFAVVGGWFLTALVAFSAAWLVAFIISITSDYVVFVFIAIALFTVFRTQLKMRKAKDNEQTEEAEAVTDNDEYEKIIEKTKMQLHSAANTVIHTYSTCIRGFLNEDRTELKLAHLEANDFEKKTKKRKAKVSSIIDKLQENDSLDIGHYYVRLMEHMRELSHRLNDMVNPLYDHFENNHKPFVESQHVDLNMFLGETKNLINTSLAAVGNANCNDNIDALLKEQEALEDLINKLEKKQIKRIKAKEVNTRNSLLYFNVLTETKNLISSYINLIKAQRDFFTNA